MKKLFGGSGGSGGGIRVDPVEHDGYLIHPAPIAESGQYRVCATITREIDGEMKEHRLIRADLLPSAEEATTVALRKARQVIAEQGDAIFS